MTIIDNYNKIVDDITNIARSCGRDPEDIKILAVSKTFSSHNVQEAIDSGISLFGENRIQEAKQKISELTGNFEFHLIGQLQSNKCKEAVQLFNMIHSIEKVSTAGKLNIEAEKINKTQNILLQVKTSFEETKTGANPDEIISIAGEILKYKNLKLMGLMTVAPYTDDKSVIRASFLRAQGLLTEINRAYNLELRELSMGMSGDYRIAVECGSTIVRIGSSIFGCR